MNVQICLMAAISDGNVITSMEPPIDQVSIIDQPVVEKPSHPSSSRSPIWEQQSRLNVVATLEPPSDLVILPAASHSNVDSSLSTDTAVDIHSNSSLAGSSLIGTTSFYGKSKHRLSVVNRTTVDNIQCPPRKKCKPTRYND